MTETTGSTEHPRGSTLHRLASRLSPSAVVAWAVLAAIPVRAMSSRLSDPDLWWHMRTGRLILETDAIPRADVYSYTVPGAPWVVQEWGAELLLHGLREAFGLWGIFAYRAAMLFVIYVLVARLLVRRMGSGMGTWGLLLLTAFAGAPNWTERPNLLSFLLFVVTLGWLERRDRRVWLFVPLAALWANLHGMVVLGLGLVLLLAVTEWLKVGLRWPGGDAAWARRLSVVTVAGTLATFLNPRGPGLLAHAFHLVRTVSNFSTEWASPDFHEVGTLLFLLLLVVTFAALALAPRRPDPTDVALALAFTVLGLSAVRNLVVASIVLGVVAARAAPDALAAVPRRTVTSRDDVGPIPSLLFGLLGVGLVVAGLAASLVLEMPRSGRVEDMVDDNYPVASIDALNRPGVRVFSYDLWSGMVIDRAWPNARVFMDLRQDMYGGAHARRYGDIISASPRWREELDASCTTHVLIERRHALAQVLALADSWVLERLGTTGDEADRQAITFARARAAPGCPPLPPPPS